MSKNLLFDFCIIPNPFSNGNRNIIFITKSGNNFLDVKISDSKDYQDIKEILEKFGYTETSELQFESSNNSKLTESTMMEMRLFLEDCGLFYSRELEVNMVRDLDNLKIKTDKIAYNNFEFIYNEPEDDNPIEEKTRNKLIKSKSKLFDFKYKEPELREKISLYFYLFLEFGFNIQGKPMIQFGGDFKDSADHDDRNYIKIAQSEFERIRDPKKPNSIILRSIKEQKDFIKEVGFLYSGYFKYQEQIETGRAMILKERKFPYKLAEVKKFLKPKQSIVIETNRMGYDGLIKFSEKIKSESVVEYNKHISTGDIEFEAEELSQFLDKKMKNLSEQEEFEAAAIMKKDVDLIKDKVKQIKKLNKTEITTEEYFKLFSL